MSAGRGWYCRVVLLGETGVGKTSVRSQLTACEFDAEHKPTSELEGGVKILKIKGTPVQVQVWDMPGDETARAEVGGDPYRRAEGFMLIYDVTNEASFDALEKYLEVLRKHASSSAIMVVANKADLADQKKVTNERAMEFCQKNNLLFAEVSPKADCFSPVPSVREAFITLCTRIAEDFGN